MSLIESNRRINRAKSRRDQHAATGQPSPPPGMAWARVDLGKRSFDQLLPIGLTDAQIRARVAPLIRRHGSDPSRTLVIHPGRSAVPKPLIRPAGDPAGPTTADLNRAQLESMRKWSGSVAEDIQRRYFDHPNPYGPGSISTYHPTLLDRVAYEVADGLGKLGFRNFYANQSGRKVANLLSFTSLGDAEELEAAGRNYMAGNWGGAIEHALKGLLGLVGGPATKRGIKAVGKIRADAAGRVRVPAQPHKAHDAPVAGGVLAGADHPLLISTRFPKPVHYPIEGNPHRTLLVQDDASYRADRKAFEKNARLLRQEPFLYGVEGDADQVVDTAIDRGTNNIVRFFEYQSPEFIDEARRTYEVAHDVLAGVARKHGVPEQAAFAVGAAMSGRKPWEVSVANTDRLLEMMGEGFDSSHPEVQRLLIERAVKEAAGVSVLPRIGRAHAERVLYTPMEGLTNLRDRHYKAVLTDQIRHDPSVRAILPDGSFGDHLRNVDWGTAEQTAKAFAIAQDPSLRNIADQMSAGGKIPAYYDLLAAPKTNSGMIPVDRQSARGATLFPIRPEDPSLKRVLGVPTAKGAEAAANSSATGSKGQQGVFGEMFHRAAAELGMSPQEVQAVVWQAMRAQPRSFFSARMRQVILDIWRTDPDEAAKLIVGLTSRQ